MGVGEGCPSVWEGWLNVREGFLGVGEGCPSLWEGWPNVGE